MGSCRFAGYFDCIESGGDAGGVFSTVTRQTRGIRARGVPVNRRMPPQGACAAGVTWELGGRLKRTIGQERTGVPLDRFQGHGMPRRLRASPRGSFAGLVPFRISNFDIEEAEHSLNSAEADFPDAVGVIFEDQCFIGGEQVPVTAGDFVFELSGAPSGVA